MIKLIFLISFVISCTRINTLTKKYPNVLITADYGVLTEDDFKMAESNRIKPIPHHDDEYGNCYKYWQCFPAKDVILQCSSWPADEPGKFLGEADIRVNSGSEHHEYGGRRGLDLEICQQSLKEWKRISDGVDTICLLGEAAGQEQKVVEGKNIVVKGWVWDVVKTKKGCNSYWGGECYTDVP